MSKKNSFSFHSLFSFSLCIYHNFLLLSLFFSFSFACSLTQFCQIALSSQSHLLGFLSSFPGVSHLHPLGLHFFSPSSLAEWPLYLFHHLFLLFSLSHSSYQVTINASQLILTLLQPISFLQLSISRMTLASFFSFILPTCLTSLTSHIHLCDLTFVHPSINVARLLYIIIEEKMNPILLFRTSCSSKPISLC